MRDIMENWRGYQEELIVEHQTLLAEGVITDALRAGFKKLFKAPKIFNNLISKAKQNFQEIFSTKLGALTKDPGVQEATQEIIATLNQMNPQTVQEVAAASGPQGGGQFSVQDLARWGVGKETLELIAHSLANANAEAILESCEKAIGKAAPPRVRDFLVRFLKKSSKMIMFGFIDNFIMIVAGDQIDTHIARSMGWSAMAAAGFGNMISDVAGEEGGSAIDTAMEKMGLDVESVSDEQMEQAPGWMQFMDRRAGTFGVAIGCLLGMIPLAFMEGEEE